MEEKVLDKENSHLYIAIDTNIVIALASLYMYEKCEDKSIVLEDFVLRENFKKFKALFEEIKKDKLRVMVTTTTFAESKLFDYKKLYSKNTKNNQKNVNYVKEFLTKYCYFPKDPANELKIRKIKRLAKEYRSKDAIPNKEYNDSMIMAEASVERLNLLTHNGKDFVFYSNNKKIDLRRKKIIKTNKENGIHIKTHYADIVPKPIMVHEFIPNEKVNHNVSIRCDDKTKVKIDQEMVDETFSK